MAVPDTKSMATLVPSTILISGTLIGKVLGLKKHGDFLAHESAQTQRMTRPYHGKKLEQANIMETSRAHKCVQPKC
jgi:hypothetical protein